MQKMLEIFGIEDEYKHLKYLPPSEDKQDIENTLAELKNRVEVQESMIFEQTKAEQISLANFKRIISIFLHVDLIIISCETLSS